MRRTRFSFFYLAGYLLFGGAGFLFFPQSMLALFRSNGEYSDLMVRLVGLMLLSLGIVIVQVIRLSIEQLYPTTLLIRSIILVSLLLLFLAYRDPLMIVLLVIVGIGFIFTTASYLWDRSGRNGS